MINQTNVESKNNKTLVMVGNLAKATHTFKSIKVLFDNHLFEDMQVLTRVLFEQMIYVRFLLEKADEEDLNAYIEYELYKKFKDFCGLYEYDEKILLKIEEKVLTNILERDKRIKEEEKQKILEIIRDAQNLLEKYGNKYKRNWHREDDFGKLVSKTDTQEIWYYKNIYSKFSSKSHSDVTSISHYFDIDKDSKIIISLDATSMRPNLVINTSAYFLIKILILYSEEVLKVNPEENEKLKAMQEYLVNEFRNNKKSKVKSI